MQDETPSTPPTQAEGTLADAIAAHLALKRDHGADSESIEHELEEALSPPRRDEPAAEPEPAEPPLAKSRPEGRDSAMPEPEATAEPEPEPEPEPELVAEPAQVDEPAPGEITGTIEFEFGGEEPPAEQVPDPAPEPADGHDLLEDTPDFFEETPEHDKLWFDEAPPRKFDF